jgi:hypothetical protein
MHATWPAPAAVILDLAGHADANNLSGAIVMAPEAGCHPRVHQPQLVGSEGGAAHRDA